MDLFNSPCTVANDDLPEVTAESIMEAVKEMERLQAEHEQSGERVDCVVAPIEWFDGMPVVKGPAGPAAISGCPYVDIGRERYVFSPECYDRIMNYRVDWNIPLQMDWGKECQKKQSVKKRSDACEALPKSWKAAVPWKR